MGTCLICGNDEALHNPSLRATLDDDDLNAPMSGFETTLANCTAFTSVPVESTQSPDMPAV